MPSYQKNKNFGRKVILAGGLVSMLGGCFGPHIEQNKDLTGDGITDIIVKKNGFGNGCWLFIGQKDGGFVRATEHSGVEDIRYFKTDEGTIYIWDGEFYRVAPQQN
jgi:hypothetical protein